MPMNATAGGAMLAGVAEAEPDRNWFGRGGCVEQHDDGTLAVFVRGELLGTYCAADVATRDVFIAVVLEQASREDLARAFRVSLATVGRVATRFKRGGARAVADYGRRGGWTVRTAKLAQRLAELFAQGLGPRAAHRVVAEKASYGTVHAMHRQWSAGRAVPIEAPAPAQQALSLGASEATPDQREEREAMATPASVEVAPAGGAHGETTLDEVAPPAGSVVQHLGSWLLLGGLRELGFYGLADQHRGDAVAMPSLRTAIDAAAIALALGEFCVEGVRRLTTPSMETLLRHVGGVSASWVRRVLHDFADVGSKTFPGAMASRLLQPTGEGDRRPLL